MTARRVSLMLEARMDVRTDLPDELSSLTNPELLAALDLVLLELEKRLLKYAQKSSGLLEMADEGLVLAARSSARISQTSSAAAHTAGHLQVVGVGDWNPRSTQPSWDSDPRVGAEGHEH